MDPDLLPPDAAFGLGCLACALAGGEGRFASYQVTAPASLTKPHFVRHAKNETHQAAMASLPDRASGSSNLPDVGAAPSLQEFQTVWQNCRKHRRHDLLDNGPKEGADNVGGPGRKKARLEIYCLAEAIRFFDRGFLRTAKMSTLEQDVNTKGGELLAHFTAVDNDLNERHGYLGLKRMTKSGHKGLLEATAEILTQASTAYYNAPGTPSTPPVHEASTLENLRQAIQVWNTDAGSDEVLAGALANSVPIPSVDAVRPLLPNIRFCNKAKDHGAGRVT